MNRSFIWGAIFGASGIAFGALGAHALKEVLTESQLSSFETGVRYQLYHALFLIMLGVLGHLKLLNKEKLISSLVIIGTLSFSFSIYLLSMQDLMEVSLKFLGPITPIGGILLIAAWVLLALNVNKTSNEENKK